MQVPISLNFDYSQKAQADGLFTDPSIVHLPKLYQGAPYEGYVRVKNLTDGTYKDFTTYDNARMDVRGGQDGRTLFSLEEDAFHFDLEASGIRIKIPAAKMAGITVPAGSVFGVSEMKFVYDIFLYRAGVVVEKFAQGTGIIVGAVTRI